VSHQLPYAGATIFTGNRGKGIVIQKERSDPRRGNLKLRQDSPNWGGKESVKRGEEKDPKSAARVSISLKRSFVNNGGRN